MYRAMAFNSLDYIQFLCTAYAVFWAMVRLPRLRLLFLLAASYLFYAAWNGWLVGLIVASSAVDYVCGGLIHRYPGRPRVRRVLLALSVLLNLGLLGYFKYTNFFIDNAGALLSLWGIDPGVRGCPFGLPGRAPDPVLNL